MKRKIAAVMAADVVGYSRLMAEDEEGTFHRLMASRAVFDDLVTRADGRVFNTAGDAVLAEFPSAVEALRIALEIQEGIRSQNLGQPESRHMRFRIGLTVGDVMERNGDLLGDAVNVAARLEGLAEPGGICVSSQFHDQVVSKVSVLFSDIGAQTVKNIPQAVRAFRVSGAPVSRRRPKRLGKGAVAAVAIIAAMVAAGWALWQSIRPSPVSFAASDLASVAKATPASTLVPAPLAAPSAAAPVALPPARCSYAVVGGRVQGQLLFFANSPWRSAESLGVAFMVGYGGATHRTHTEAIRDAEGYAFTLALDADKTLTSLDAEVSAPSGLVPLACRPG